jgi:hypothetical protein
VTHKVHEGHMYAAQDFHFESSLSRQRLEPEIAIDFLPGTTVQEMPLFCNPKKQFRILLVGTYKSDKLLFKISSHSKEPRKIQICSLNATLKFAKSPNISENRTRDS